MLTTSGTYPWSFVTHIFHNGQSSHGGSLLLYITPVSPANQNHTIIIKGLKANISIFIYQMNFTDYKLQNINPWQILILIIILFIRISEYYIKYELNNG